MLTNSINLLKQKKITVRRYVEILKDKERFSYRLRMKSWKTPSDDIDFRLFCLIHFSPSKSNRQIFNQARICSLSKISH